MPNKVAILINNWGNNSNSEQYGRTIKYLNQTKEKYESENDVLEYYEGLVNNADPRPNIST